jgi:RNA:NAD 2'-phosphotransferase (TPT1/KptA family)
MTADGWAPVADVCTMLDIDRTTLLRAVEHNDKSRLQLDGDRIRAGQGHSRAGMPVTLDALERSWRKVEPDDLLWHGTSVSAVEGIAWHVPVSCISRVESASEAGAEALESVRHALLGDAVHWVGWSGR